MTKKNIENLCRLCVKESHSYKHIYDQYILDIRLFEVINDLCQLDVSEDDGLPAYICEECHAKLLDFRNFKSTSHEGKIALLSIKLKCDKVTSESGYLDSVLLGGAAQTDVPHTADWSREQIADMNFQQLLEVSIKEEPEDNGGGQQEGQDAGQLDDSAGCQCNNNVDDSRNSAGVEASGVDEVHCLGSQVFIKSEPIDPSYGDAVGDALATSCGVDDSTHQVFLKSEPLSGDLVSEEVGESSAMDPDYDPGTFSPQVVRVSGNGIQFNPMSCMQQMIRTCDEDGQFKQEHAELEESLRRSDFGNDSSLSCSFTADESSCDGFSSSSQINGSSTAKRRRDHAGYDGGRPVDSDEEWKPELIGLRDFDGKGRSNGKRPYEESEADRQARLKRMREYEIRRRATETVVQRERRLMRMRDYFARKLAKENEERRQERLLQYRLCQARRLMLETEQQREARLLKCREYMNRTTNPKKENANSMGRTRAFKPRHNSGEFSTNSDVMYLRGSSCVFPVPEGIATTSRERASKTRACKAIRLSCEKKRLSGVETHSSSDSDEVSSSVRNSKRKRVSPRLSRRSERIQSIKSSKESDPEFQKSASSTEGLTDEDSQLVNTRPNTRARTRCVTSSKEYTTELQSRSSARKADETESCARTRLSKYSSEISNDTNLRSNPNYTSKSSKRNNRSCRSGRDSDSEARHELDEGNDETDRRKRRKNTSKSISNNLDPVNGPENTSNFESNGGDEDHRLSFTMRYLRLRKSNNLDTRMPSENAAVGQEPMNTVMFSNSNPEDECKISSFGSSDIVGDNPPNVETGSTENNDNETVLGNDTSIQIEQLSDNNKKTDSTVQLLPERTPVTVGNTDTECTVEQVMISRIESVLTESMETKATENNPDSVVEKLKVSTGTKDVNLAEHDKVETVPITVTDSCQTMEQAEDTVVTADLSLIEQGDRDDHRVLLIDNRDLNFSEQNEAEVVTTSVTVTSETVEEVEDCVGGIGMISGEYVGNEGLPVSGNEDFKLAEHNEAEAVNVSQISTDQTMAMVKDSAVMTDLDSTGHVGTEVLSVSDDEDSDLVEHSKAVSMADIDADQTVLEVKDSAVMTDWNSTGHVDTKALTISDHKHLNLAEGKSEAIGISKSVTDTRHTMGKIKVTAETKHSNLAEHVGTKHMSVSIPGNRTGYAVHESDSDITTTDGSPNERIDSESIVMVKLARGTDCLDKHWSGRDAVKDLNLPEKIYNYAALLSNTVSDTNCTSELLNGKVSHLEQSFAEHDYLDSVTMPANCTGHTLEQLEASDIQKNLERLASEASTIDVVDNDDYVHTKLISNVTTGDQSSSSSICIVSACSVALQDSCVHPSGQNLKKTDLESTVHNRSRVVPISAVGSSDNVAVEELDSNVPAMVPRLCESEAGLGSPSLLPNQNHCGDDHLSCTAAAGDFSLSGTVRSGPPTDGVLQASHSDSTASFEQSLKDLIDFPGGESYADPNELWIDS